MTAHWISRTTIASRIAGMVALAAIAILAAAPWWASSATLRLIGDFAV